MPTMSSAASSAADAAAGSSSDDPSASIRPAGGGGGGGGRRVVTGALRGRSPGAMPSDDRSGGGGGGESEGEGGRGGWSDAEAGGADDGSVGVGVDGAADVSTMEDTDSSACVTPSVRTEEVVAFEGGLLGASSTPRKAEAAQAASIGLETTSAAEAQLLSLEGDEEGPSATKPILHQAAIPAATSSEASQTPHESTSAFGAAAGDKRRGTTRSSMFRPKISSGGGSTSSIFYRGKAAEAASDTPESASAAWQEHGDDEEGETSSDSDRSFHSPLQEMEQISADGGAAAAHDADLVNMLMRSSPNRNRKRPSARASARAVARRSKAKREERSATVSDDDEESKAASTESAALLSIEEKHGDRDEKKKCVPLDVDEFGEDSSSDDEASQAARRAMTYSKYDYDMNWDMIGQRRRIDDVKDDSGNNGGQKAETSDVTSSDGASADAPVEADAAGITDGTAPSSAASATITTGRSIASGCATRNDGGTSVAVSLTGTTDATEAGAIDPILPPLHLHPRRRRTHSSPGGTISSMTYAPAVPARTRRQYYAYQRRDLLDDESNVDVDVVDYNDGEFGEIQNWDDEDDENEADGGEDGGRQSSSAGFFDEFDDFAGTPVSQQRKTVTVADTTSEAGDESIGTAEGGVSVSTGSSSSSSSMRRRALFSSSVRSAPAAFGPGAVSGGVGTGNAGLHSAPSVSSFTASTSSMPAGPPSRSSSRRRLNPRAASRAGRRRRRNNGTRAAEGSGDSSSGGGAGAVASRTLPSSPSSSSSALRSSLDSGMAALRRWARSRTVTASVPNVGSGPRPSRAVSTQLRLGEEDIFALSNAGSRDLQRGGAGLARTRSHDYDEEFRHDIFGMGRMYPPPIAEEEDEAGASSGSPARGGLLRGLRQRAFSEPDRPGLMRELFFSMGRTGVGGSWRRRGNRQRRDGSDSREELDSQRRSPNIWRQQSGGSADQTPRRRGQRQRQQRQQRYTSSDDDTLGPDAVDRSVAGAGRSESFVSSHDAASSNRSTNAPVAPPYLSSMALSASSLFQSPERAPSASGRDTSDVLGSGRNIGGVGAAPLSVLRSGNNGDEEMVTEETDGGRRDTSDDDIGEGEARGTLEEADNAGAPSPIANTGADSDPNREARGRWIRINRRFQLIITIVALIFSMLLFAILVCWVVLTSAYVVSIDKVCDVPLKTYFWLATLQLILDVFRTDIIRFVFRWDANSRQRMPLRVIVYNIAYLVYAVMVLRMGIRSVFVADGTTCPRTAPELFQTSMAFVILSLAAWSTIVIGYLGPFCFVAVVLTRNGYSPSADIDGSSVTTGGPIPGVGGVFPATYSSNAAPPGTADRLRVVLLDEFPEEYPKECCICMGDFTTGEIIVATECDHVFHKRCCQEWLRQARTCPVCRTDIPNSLPGRGANETEMLDEESYPGRDYNEHPNRPPLNREEFHHEVVNLLRILRRHEERLRERLNSPHSDGNDVEMGDVRTTREASSQPSAGVPNMLTDEAESDASSSVRSLEEGRSVATRRSRSSAV